MSNESYIRLKGKRCIGLVRCSTIGQADTSIPDQIAALRKFAAEHGLIIVDIVILPGVSGSIPGNRDDLEQLVNRKRERDDFEFLLVFDMTRLTRGGARHGNKIEYDFLAEGVEIVYVMEQLPQGAAGELVRSAHFFSANEQARAIAKNSARGSMSALEQG